jgi:hypothetical protein
MATDMVIDPRGRHLEEFGGLLNGQQFVLSDRGVLGVHGSPSVRSTEVGARQVVS